MSALIWAALGGLAMLTESTDPLVGTGIAQFGVASLATVYGLLVFWRHGGRQVTAAGLYSLASAVFVGLAGLYWWAEQGSAVPRGLYLATAIGYFANLAMHRLFWHDPRPPQQPPPAALEPVRWAILAGGLVAGGALAMHLGGLSVGSILLSELIFGGMVVVMVAVLVHPATRVGRGVGPLRLALVGLVVALYATTVFTGYGRLLLVSLGLAAAVPACVRLPGHTVKAMLLAAIGPALVVLTHAREQFGLATYGAELDGSGSVTLPLADFGRLIALHQHGLLDLGHGSTLLVSAIFFVPRAIWPDKPLGFGAELTRILDPQLVAIDQSLAAHLGGEWLYDFGYLGIPAMILVMGWAIGRLDRFAAARMHRPLTDRRAVLVLAAVVILLAGIPDLEWAGTYTYWSRTASRLVVPLALLLLSGRRPAPGADPGARPASPAASVSPTAG